MNRDGNLHFVAHKLICSFPILMKFMKILVGSHCRATDPKINECANHEQPQAWARGALAAHGK